MNSLNDIAQELKKELDDINFNNRFNIKVDNDNISIHTEGFFTICSLNKILKITNKYCLVGGILYYNVFKVFSVGYADTETEEIKKSTIVEL